MRRYRERGSSLNFSLNTLELKVYSLVVPKKWEVAIEILGLLCRILSFYVLLLPTCLFPLHEETFCLENNPVLISIVIYSSHILQVSWSSFESVETFKLSQWKSGCLRLKQWLFVKVSQCLSLFFSFFFSSSLPPPITISSSVLPSVPTSLSWVLSKG